MKPILYIDQQIIKAKSKSLKISNYIDKNRSLKKSDLRKLLADLNFHLENATNIFISEENHETEDERNAVPKEFMENYNKSIEGFDLPEGF